MNESMYVFQQTLNEWGRQRRAGLFLVDFELERPLCYPLDEIRPSDLLYDFQGIGNGATEVYPQSAHIVASHPVSHDHYRKAFEVVQSGLMRGDSFLTNLTMPTELELCGDLRQIFYQSQARYKLWLRDQWVCFSPETFVQLKGGCIYAYPMKGTRTALDPRGGERLLADPKEKAEHATIVDLIRNDLSQVARGVAVSKYRYLEKVPTARGGLWQTSSCISGALAPDYLDQLGDLLVQLLPAGSISGAPKCKTLQIIRQAEGQPRGYYTGVAGLFDGQNVDSCVLIRFIEQRGGGYRYWSGGGITARSNWPDEYQEILEKVYLST